MKKMKQNWMIEGTPWPMVGILHAQSLLMYFVPKLNQVLTMDPRFQRQL